MNNLRIFDKNCLNLYCEQVFECNSSRQVFGAACAVNQKNCFTDDRSMRKPISTLSGLRLVFNNK